MLQNRSWKIDENIFHQKCPKQHFLATESVAGDTGDDISSKNHENSCFFLPVCHCGTLHSKSAIPCARPSTALWHTFGRCTAEALSLRVLGARISPSSIFMSWMSTNTLCNISLVRATTAEQSPAPPGMI